MNYALLDWDNTLRKGYTLFTWIDYLIDRGIIGNIVREEIEYYIKEYKKHEITHDQLAEVSCAVFSNSIKGMKKTILEQQLNNYMQEDNNNLYGFTSEIFNVLNDYEILPIIVSGAPRDILEKYRKKFKIYKIYGFVAEHNDGEFSGNVLFNYGYNKGIKVEEIYKKMGGFPKMAFGDSVSDFEMLHRAEKSVIVCENGKNPMFKADGIIEQNMPSLEVKRLLIDMIG